MSNNQPKRPHDPHSAIEDAGEPDLPEQDNEVPPPDRSRREAAGEKLELSRTGIAASGALLDADPDLDRMSETEEALKETLAAQREAKR